MGSLSNLYLRHNKSIFDMQIGESWAVVKSNMFPNSEILPINSYDQANMSDKIKTLKELNGDDLMVYSDLETNVIWSQKPAECLERISSQPGKNRLPRENTQINSLNFKVRLLWLHKYVQFIS